VGEKRRNSTELFMKIIRVLIQVRKAACELRRAIHEFEPLFVEIFGLLALLRSLHISSRGFLRKAFQSRRNIAL
jgi:hypothetical protein